MVFTIPKTELSKAQRNCKKTRSKPQAVQPKSPLDVDETKIRTHKATERRHAREWVRLNVLKEKDVVVTVHYREVLRHKIFLLMRKKPLSDHHWRKRITLEWDEALFRAVFRPLGQPTKPTVLPCPKKLAMTLDGAWASSSVRMLQILARPGKLLCDFLALDDFQRSPLYLASGYAFKHIDIRFVLELAAVFECKYSKMPGNRMKVSVFVTVARVSKDGVFFELLLDPKRSSSDVAPVFSIPKYATKSCFALTP